MKRRQYTVRYERDEDGWWVAVASGAPAQTQGRTIEQAQERIRDALGVLLDVEPEQLELDHDVRLPAAARRVLGTAKRASVRAAGEVKRAERATRDAARTLVKCGMSLRDAGTLLGVSRQRVHQILDTKGARRKGAA